MVLFRHNLVCTSNVKTKKQSLNVLIIFQICFVCATKTAPAGGSGGVWSLMFRQYCGYLKGSSSYMCRYILFLLRISTFYLVTLNVSNL